MLDFLYQIFLLAQNLSKCFENFVSQTLGVLARIYAAELRENVKFSGIAQKGFTHKLLSQTDYLINARFGGIPVFSERFIERTRLYLSDKISFYPCQILLNNKSYNFFLCRIKQIMPVIDYEKSGYRILSDGNKIVDEPIIIKENVNEELLIVRDSTYKSKIIVSNLFKKIVEKEQLNVGFYNTSQSFW